MLLIEEQFNRVVQEKAKSTGGLFGAKEDGGEDSVVLPICNLLVESTVRLKASDLHVESQEGFLRVRYRIDGILHEGVNIPQEFASAVIARLRIMSGMDPESGLGRFKPQDGRIKKRIGDQEFDFRVSTFPGMVGEKIVMRLLGRSESVQDLSKLGLSAHTMKRVDQAISNPSGIFLVTGPTGHGKSTTLYSILKKLNTPSVNIMTMEDPVELRLPNITQASVNVKAGFTFADGLRAILRQDPNIVMVGEIRDRETADIAIRASLTGHLVFSTLHTNNAVGSITRFLDMGVESHLLASALVGSAAQRLVRRVCTKCIETKPMNDQHVEKLKLYSRGNPLILKYIAQVKEFSYGRGCAACNQTGYTGRVALFELCLNTHKLRELVTQKAPLEALQNQALSDGMEPLIVDGLRKIAERTTSLAELFRVINSV